MNLLAQRHRPRRKRRVSVGVKCRPKLKPPQRERPSLSASVEGAVRSFAEDPLTPPHTLKLAVALSAFERRSVHLLATALGLRSRSCGQADSRRVVLHKGGDYKCPDCGATFWAWAACLAHCREQAHGGDTRRLQQRCKVGGVRAAAAAKPPAARPPQSDSSAELKRAIARRRKGWPPMPGDSPADELPPLPSARRGGRKRRPGAAAAAAALRDEARASRRSDRQAGKGASTAAAIATAAAAPPLDASNRGHWLLTNLGWSPGAGLGAAEAGGVELVSALLPAQASRQGLGLGTS